MHMTQHEPDGIEFQGRKIAKRVIVNGDPFVMLPFKEGELKPGCLIGQRYGRRVYRVLCFDGDDVILRNARKASIVVALTRKEVIEEFRIVLPDIRAMAI